MSESTEAMRRIAASFRDAAEEGEYTRQMSERLDEELERTLVVADNSEDPYVTVAIIDGDVAWVEVDPDALVDFADNPLELSILVTQTIKDGIDAFDYARREYARRIQREAEDSQ